MIDLQGYVSQSGKALGIHQLNAPTKCKISRNSKICDARPNIPV